MIKIPTHFSIYKRCCCHGTYLGIWIIRLGKQIWCQIWIWYWVYLIQYDDKFAMGNTQPTFYPWMLRIWDIFFHEPGVYLLIGGTCPESSNVWGSSDFSYRFLHQQNSFQQIRIKLSIVHLKQKTKKKKKKKKQVYYLVRDIKGEHHRSTEDGERYIPRFLFCFVLFFAFVCFMLLFCFVFLSHKFTKKKKNSPKIQNSGLVMSKDYCQVFVCWLAFVTVWMDTFWLLTSKGDRVERFKPPRF